MRVEIKDVKACRNGAMGNFLLRGHSSALITLSLSLNNMAHDYACTLLHELLHLYVTLLRVKGLVKVSNKREHLFIGAVERSIVRHLRKYCRRRPK